jgi:hypothetical protein
MTQIGDRRDRDPDEAHRAAFLAGWTDAIHGKLYRSSRTRRTHANMGNLFGWIYGDQPMDFKLETWYCYLGHSVKHDLVAKDTETIE